jgi:ATP-dependent RNA helicase DDX56/DBP9
MILRIDRYHIVEEFNRGKYDYIVATDESDPSGAEYEQQTEQAPEEASTSKLIPSGATAVQEDEDEEMVDDAEEGDDVPVEEDGEDMETEGMYDQVTETPKDD